MINVRNFDSHMHAIPESVCTVDSFQGTEDLVLQAQFYKMGFNNKFLDWGGLKLLYGLFCHVFRRP